MELAKQHQQGGQATTRLEHHIAKYLPGVHSSESMICMNSKEKLVFSRARISVLVRGGQDHPSAFDEVNIQRWEKHQGCDLQQDVRSNFT